MRGMIAVVALLAAIRPAVADVLQFDDFNDDTLDPVVWSAALPFGGSAVDEQNQRVEFRQRGYLITQQEFDPAVDGPLRISGLWTFVSPSGTDTDHFSLATRSDGVPSGSFGEVQNGIVFKVQGEFNDAEILRFNNGILTEIARFDDQLDVSVGDTFRFEITDDGNSVSMLFEEIGDPSSSVYLTATDSTNFATDRIAFYNRETGSLSYLDDVLVEQVPEPSAFLMSMLGLLGWGGAAARRFYKTRLT